MSALLRKLIVAALFPLVACDAQIGTYEEGVGEDTVVGEEVEIGDGIAFLVAGSVESAVSSGCSTSVVRGLSEQLVAEIEVIRPNTLKSIANTPGIQMGSSVFPYLQVPAANALQNAMSAGGTIQVNSALRSLAQQFVLYQWYLSGRCGISLAARPGTSNHERGLAIDVQNYSQLKSRLESKGFDWLGGNDPVHFDYVNGGTDLSGLSILAFQRLWNRNNPGDKISEDGSYGPQTENRLKKAPAAGFSIGPVGTNPPPAIQAIGFDWFRNAGGDYDFAAGAPTEVVKVDYLIDGYKIGTATRSNGDDFYINYTFNYEISKRKVELNGYNASNVLIAKGIGLIDSIPQTATFIWHRAERTYTVGVERAPAGVVAIEVRVDGTLLTDSVSGLTRSTRLAVRHTYNTLGARHFQVKMFNANGGVVGTFERDLTIQ